MRLPRPKSSPSEKAVQAAVALCCALVIVIAIYLVPDPRGYGTHEQLGLPPCSLAERFNFPGPTCGLTTSFAHMGDLAPVQAFLAQPLGVIGFAMGVAVVLGAAVSVPLGISWLPFLRRVKWPVAAWTALGVGIASWVFEIIRWKLMG